VCYGHLNIRNLGNHCLLFRRCGLTFKIAGNAVFEVFCFAYIKDFAAFIEHFVNARALGQRFQKIFAIKWMFLGGQWDKTQKSEFLGRLIMFRLKPILTFDKLSWQ
jgi:hypothetical protein